MAVDPLVLIFTALISLATGLLFGFAPLVHTRMKGLMAALQQGGTRGAIGSARHHVRWGLVMGEIALAVMVAVGAGLLARTVDNLTSASFSHMVVERRRELGIRMALGADRASVLGLVMRQGLLLTLAGMVVGLLGALGLNRSIASLLFGVRPTDATTLAWVITAIALVAATACWLPAWRASRLDPNTVLHED